MRILLIGGTSYVASFFIEECVRRGWDVFTLGRDRVRQTILSFPSSAIAVVSNLDETRALRSVDAVVNFAYPVDVGTMKIHAATRRLIGNMLAGARELSPRVVVQVSTQSVFGYAFAREPRPVPVWWAAGDSYIETKFLAEALVLLKSRGAPYVPVILRLGNVIGPGAYWISEIAGRLLFGNPLGRGKSNATYARNVADYLSHILTVDEGALRAFGVFHHLAEFSSYSWTSFIEPIAEAIGVQPTYRDAPVSPTRADGRRYLRAAVRYLSMVLPETWQDRIDALFAARRLRYRPLDDVEDGELEHPTLHQLGEFRSHTLPGWRARFDMQVALDDILAWVRGAGFVALD